MINQEKSERKGDLSAIVAEPARDCCGSLCLCTHGMTFYEGLSAVPE